MGHWGSKSPLPTVPALLGPHLWCIPERRRTRRRRFRESWRWAGKHKWKWWWWGGISRFSSSQDLHEQSLHHTVLSRAWKDLRESIFTLRERKRRPRAARNVPNMKIPPFWEDKGRQTKELLKWSWCKSLYGFMYGKPRPTGRNGSLMVKLCAFQRVDGKRNQKSVRNQPGWASRWWLLHLHVINWKKNYYEIWAVY